jgi:hypothetical protein
MITREQAREIAERFLAERGPVAGWDGVDRVLSPEEAGAELSPELRAAAVVGPRWRRCWAVYFRGEAGGIIYVSRDTGEVEFAGAAQGGP